MPTDPSSCRPGSTQPRAHEEEGNIAEALAVYDRLRIRLRDELGAAPGKLTQALYRELLG